MNEGARRQGVECLIEGGTAAAFAIDQRSVS